jgi:beta-mannosidase
MAPLTRIPVDKGWQFKQSTTLANNTASAYLPVSQFPTVAHLDLLHHSLIKDPYIDTNELDSLWVNDANFTYRTILPSLPDLGEGKQKVVLVFEGLDTLCSVYLNSSLILESKNMHISYRVDITSLLHSLPSATKEVELRLEFKNAPEYAKSEMKRIGYKGNGTDVHFGGPERLFVRKAQYHWGWDWGPALNTSGPWKPVYIETLESRVAEFLVRQEVSDDLKTAVVKITGSVEGAEAGSEVELQVLSPTGESVLKEAVKTAEDGTFKAELKIENPDLWYPFAYGAQPLYTVSASLPGLDTQERKIGFRRLRLLQNKLKKEEGTSFTFEVNNIRVFCGGSCWIPGDLLLPRFTVERYRSWLELAKSGNQTMIRVWGGGLVESDDFYAIADELGILVWQDFLFACGDYPAEDNFVENVKGEAEEQVKRVGHHASLVIWAGNNEDYMLAERWGWEYDVNDQEGPWDHTNFPARKIYERVLPEICERLAGDVPYWRSSPYGGKTSNDLTIGDTHIWDGSYNPFSSPPLSSLIRANSMARQAIPLPSLQILPQSLYLRIWLRVRAFPTHSAPSDHLSLRAPLAIPDLRCARQRPRASTSLWYVQRRELPLPLQPAPRLRLL